jgi:hypothetical protein
LRSIARESRDIFAIGRVVSIEQRRRRARRRQHLREPGADEMLIFFSAVAQRFLDGTVNAF